MLSKKYLCVLMAQIAISRNADRN